MVAIVFKGVTFDPQLSDLAQPMCMRGGRNTDEKGKKEKNCPCVGGMGIKCESQCCKVLKLIMIRIKKNRIKSKTKLDSLIVENPTSEMIEN